jgi:hypothetical protein
MDIMVGRKDVETNLSYFVHDDEAMKRSEPWEEEISVLRARVAIITQAHLLISSHS